MTFNAKVQKAQPLHYWTWVVNT